MIMIAGEEEERNLVISEEIGNVKRKFSSGKGIFEPGKFKR